MLNWLCQASGQIDVEQRHDSLVALSVIDRPLLEGKSLGSKTSAIRPCRRESRFLRFGCSAVFVVSTPQNLGVLGEIDVVGEQEF